MCVGASHHLPGKCLASCMVGKLIISEYCVNVPSFHDYRESLSDDNNVACDM